MLLLRAVLLWSLVSLHVVGGAAVFRRFFPRESPWWGFFLPSLALVACAGQHIGSARDDARPALNGISLINFEHGGNLLFIQR